jgi:hypothetical protein
MATIACIPFDVNPHVAIALEQLGVLLDDYSYSQHAKERILAYTAANGTPSMCPELDASDEHDAEMVFVAELPAIPLDDPAWDREDTFLDAAMLADGTHPSPFGEPRAPDEDYYHPYSPNHPANRSVTLPPVSGGCDEEPEGFVPSPSDWDSYREWSERLDAERDLEDMRRWYKRHDLSEFNDHIRND